MPKKSNKNMHAVLKFVGICYLCNLKGKTLMKKYVIFLLLCVMSLHLVAMDKRHTEFVRLSLGMSQDELISCLVQKGLRQESSHELSGRVAGLKVWLYVEANKDTTGCSHLMLTTQEQQGISQRDDYVALMRWMQKHYGLPQWESTVRGHRFARWFLDFDRDIVMIATASSAVEIWFYDNHQKRNIDYYAILKQCERTPIEGVPYLTAQQQVTWKRDSIAEKKTVTKRGKNRWTPKKHAKHHKKHSRRRR